MHDETATQPTLQELLTDKTTGISAGSYLSQEQDDVADDVVDFSDNSVPLTADATHPKPHQQQQNRELHDNMNNKDDSDRFAIRNMEKDLDEFREQHPYEDLSIARLQQQQQQQQQQLLPKRSLVVPDNCKPVITRRRLYTAASSCYESQSSTSSGNSNRAARIRSSHVTFDGDTACSSLGEDQGVSTLSCGNSPLPIQSSSPIIPRPASSFSTPASILRANRGVGTEGGASSEEDSVAEMDYMSENSNVSVAAKDLTPEDTTTTLTPDVIPGVSHFLPKRIPTTTCSLSPGTLGKPGGSPSSNKKIGTTPLRKTKPKTKDKLKLPHKPKLMPSSISSPSDHIKAERFRPISLDRKLSPLASAFRKTTTTSSTTTTTTNTTNGATLPLSGVLPCKPLPATAEERAINDSIIPSIDNNADGEHRALYLPKFRHPKTCMWTASHAANCPSEDRSASLVNLVLQPLPPNFDSETQLPPLEADYKTLIRLNLWSVIDGHGGGCVATYGSEVLLPHIAASISRALGCAIVDRGVCTVNGQLRDANALDLDGLIQTQSDRYMGNPNSIHYRSPYERSDSDAEEEEEECDNATNLSEADYEGTGTVPQTPGERKRIKSLINATGASLTGSLLKEQEKGQDKQNQQHSTPSVADASVSSVKTSVKTAASPPTGEEALVGTHSPREVAAITRAITESFLAVDEAWINSIDPVATHQTSCQSNGRWNSGACALVVFTVQRLDWTNVSEPDREKELMEPEKSRQNTSQNRDAARRRMLDYAARTKSASSMSTVSSTSSLTTEEAVNASGIESEITETEGEDDDRSFNNDVRKREPISLTRAKARLEKVSSLISPPGGCSCHCYRAHGAMIYTAHVGDCRAVMLGSAPPRTIKVGDFSSLHQDTTDDESSHHSSDETECLSSSDLDADSSEDDDLEAVDGSSKSAATSSFMNFPRRVVRQRNARSRLNDDKVGPYVALPPLILPHEESARSVEFDVEEAYQQRRGDGGRRQQRVEPSDSSSASSEDSIDLLPLIHLPPVTRPIDLTTDHSAYNPAEVTAVLRRCNNAPRAISAGVGGGIKRVAGSLAVTRALGDAYLKTPLLSFLPYKSHAPYITARPEVNCRPLVKDGDKVLILATDGVWERASGEDALRWVRNFYEERLAEAVRRNNRRSNNQLDKSSFSTSSASNEDGSDTAPKNNKSTTTSSFFHQEGSERDLFEHKNDPVDVANTVSTSSSRKREAASSPILNNSGAGTTKRRRRSRPTNANNTNPRISYNVADVIVRRVLNKVRRARNISSLQALMSLPQGRARRSKHDDITASVIDLSAFVS